MNMKKALILLLVLTTISIKMTAQIPNHGFEDWTMDTSGIEIPSDVWVTDNLVEKPLGVTYNPVTKSSDHYPQNIGIYSIRLENNITFVNTNPESPYPYWRIAYGSTATAPLTSNYLGYYGPSFPITGHPTNFCGYYKFLPQNNDTLTIRLILFQNGSPVATAFLNSTNIVSDWTSFNLPISAYTTSDSAQIWLMAQKTVPQGNSILYVDNLSFDNLITTLSEQTSDNIAFSLYPNPASDIVTLNIDNRNNAALTLNIYNITGTLVRQKILKQYQKQINIRNLSNGFYLVTIKSKDLSITQKLIIQR
jgi:hypothetical protein